MVALLLLQTAVMFGTCDGLPMMDSEHWQRPEMCETADAIADMRPSVYGPQSKFQAMCDAWRVSGNVRDIEVSIGAGDIGTIECADYPATTAKGAR